MKQKLYQIEQYGDVGQNRHIYVVADSAQEALDIVVRRRKLKQPEIISIWHIGQRLLADGDVFKRV